MFPGPLGMFSKAFQNLHGVSETLVWYTADELIQLPCMRQIGTVKLDFEDLHMKYDLHPRLLCIH